MNDSLRLGRIAGIPIGINWTWALVFVVFTWSLAVAVFPMTNPGLSGPTYVAMAVVAELLFFASLLLHELGHALVARRERVAIEGITLWLFGGVARFRGVFPSAGAEFRIAIAGPIVTAVLGAVFIGLALTLPLGPAVDGVTAWLGYINLLLLGFNLLPALPLDGGRILRAALWSARKDYGWATRISALIARGIGIAMIAGGVALFLFHGELTDLWLALIGWFLLGAARAETRLAWGREALAGLVVADLVMREPLSARPDEPLRDFVEHAAWRRRRPAYPVLDRGRPVGLLVPRDVAHTTRRDWPALRVRDVMLPLGDIPIVDAHDPAVEALSALLGDEDGLVLVFDRATLVGVLELRDIEPFLVSRGARRLRPALGRDCGDVPRSRRWESRRRRDGIPSCADPGSRV